MKVAVIPARGGSKRIPKKNIKKFAGKPLIEYAINGAKNAKVFDKIIVSTDELAIAEVAKKSGADVPFLRPAELSDDYTPTIPVLKHAINWLIEDGGEVDCFCCIYPNPFITSKNLEDGYSLLKEKNAYSVLPVTTYPVPIYFSVHTTEDGTIDYVFPEKSMDRSQDLPEVYYDAGQFCWWDSKAFMTAEDMEKFRRTKRYPLFLPPYLVQDIDTLEDWDVAEKLFDALVKNDDY